MRATGWQLWRFRRHTVLIEDIGAFAECTVIKR
jgi:hypothetical protein